MLILLSFLAFIAGLLIIIAIIGLTLPRVATFDKVTDIDSDFQTVFNEVSNLRNFVTWSPWTEHDPNMKMKWSGEDGTIGSSYTWKGNRKVGEGQMTIIDLQPSGLVAVSLDFGQRGQAKAYFIVEDIHGKSRVTWRFESDMGNALRRGAMTRFMKNFVGKDFERGLQNLKNKLEKN